jgi:hypothetical protein
MEKVIQGDSKPGSDERSRDVQKGMISKGVRSCHFKSPASPSAYFLRL